MALESPPIYDPVINEEGKANLSWTLFFNAMFNGDSGNEWAPEFVDLTEAGGDATITGRYLRINKYVTIFWVKVVPATSTTSTSGTTYITGFPLTFNSDGIVFAVSGGSGSNSGHIVSSSQRIYTPAWSAVTVDLYVIGIGFTQ